MIGDIMTKALAKERHLRLMGLTLLRVEDSQIGKESTSGSEELRNSHYVAKR